MNSSKFFKIISVGVLALALMVFTGGVANAVVTIDATSVISSAALTLTGAATSVWSLSTGALTIDSGTTSALNFGTAAAAKTITIGNAASTLLDLDAISIDIDGAGTGVTIDALDAGTLNIGTSAVAASDTSAINIGTSATARTITIGNAASTILDLNAISVDIDGAATGVTIDALDAGSINLGTSADTASDTSAINIGTSATARTISLGGGAASTFVVNGRVASEAITGTEIGLGATYAYGEGLEMRYGVDSWTGIGNSFKGYYFRSSANVGSATGGLRGMEVYGVSNVTTGTTGLSNLQSLYAEMLVKASATSKTITDASSVEANVSIENQTGTLTFTNNVYALKAKVQTGTGLADYTKMGGIAVQGRDDGTSRVFGNAISIENPEATVATWTRGLSISAGTATAISITGATTTDISLQNGETIANGTDGQFLFSRNTDAGVTIMAADSASPANLTIDTTGAGTITVGSADVTVVTITSAATDAGLVLPLTSVGAGEIVTDTLTATQLAATITFADADLVDLSAILHDDAAAQGLKLPTKTGTPTAMTSNPEGHIMWDSTNNLLYVSTDAGWASTFNNTASANTWTNVNTFQDNEIFTLAGDEDIAITSTATTTTVVPIVANSLTTGIGESIASTAAAITGAGRLLYVNHGGATSTDGILSEFTTAATDETVVLRVSSAAMIDGVNLSVVGTTGMTTGSLIRATTSTAALVATNGIVSIRGTGAHTSTANAGLLDVQSSGLVGTAANGTLVNFQTTAAAQVDTTVLNVENSGFTTGYTGSMLRIKSVTTTGAARVVDLIADGITSGGTAMKISTAALTTGDGLLITNGTSAITTGSLLNVTASGTGTIATDGVVKFSHAGIYDSTSNAGFVNITANATLTGTVLAVNATALTTGIGIYSPSAEAGLTGAGRYMSLGGGVFSVAVAGATTIAGSAAGTAALTLSLGDLVLVDTNTTTITSVDGTTTVVLIDNAGGVQADNTAALLIDSGGNNASGSNMLRLAPTGTPVEGSIGIEFVGSAKVMQAMNIDGDSVNNSVVLLNGGGALADNKAVLEVTADGTMVAGSSLVRIASATAAGGATVYGLEISANAANLEGLWVSAGKVVFAEDLTVDTFVTADAYRVTNGAAFTAASNTPTKADLQAASFWPVNTATNAVDVDIIAMDAADIGRHLTFAVTTGHATQALTVTSGVGLTVVTINTLGTTAEDAGDYIECLITAAATATCVVYAGD